MNCAITESISSRSKRVAMDVIVLGGSRDVVARVEERLLRTLRLFEALPAQAKAIQKRLSGLDTKHTVNWPARVYTDSTD